jgi:hypothetical protein
MTDAELVREIVQPLVGQARKWILYGAVAEPGETDHDSV